MTIDAWAGAWHVDIYEPDNTELVTVIDEPSAADVTRERDDDGSGTFAIRTTHPAVAECTEGRLARFYLNGRLRFTGRLGPFEDARVVESGDAAGALVSFTTPGHKSVLNGAAIGPAEGTQHFQQVQSRVFGWMSPIVDPGEWEAPTYAGAVYEVGQERPKAYPDAFGGKFEVGARRYFQRQFTILTTLCFVPYLSAHQHFNLYVNETPIGSGATSPNTSRGETYRGPLILEPGTHTIAAMASRTLDAIADDSWFTLTAWYSALSGTTGSLNINTFLFHTGYLPSTTTIDPAWISSAVPLGPTPGRLVRKWIEDAQGRGEIPQVTLGFTDTEDSNGNPWTERVDEMVVQVGSSIGSNLATLDQTYTTSRMAPDSNELQLFNFREAGNYHEGELTAPGVEYASAAHGPAPSVGRVANVRGLEYGKQKSSIEAPRRLWVIGEQRSDWYGDGPGEGRLDLSQYSDWPTIEKIAQATIDAGVEAAEALSVTGTVRPSHDDDDMLAEGFGPGIGDAVVLPSRFGGGVERLELVSVNLARDEERPKQSVMRFTAGSPLQVREAQQRKWLARISPVGLERDFQSVSSGSPRYGTDVAFGTLPEVVIEPFSNSAMAEGQISSPYPIEQPTRLFWWAWGLRDAGADDTVILLRLNGTTVFEAITIPAGAGLEGGASGGLGEHYTNLACTNGDYIDAVIDTLGAGANGITLRLFATSQI